MTDENSLTDEELMAAVIGGRLEEMDRLFARHNDAIVAYCAKLTGEWDTARDLAQETFMRVFHKRETFDPDSRFKPWIFTVARNACVDHLRKKQTISVDPAIIDMRDRQALASERLEHKQNLDRLRNALQRLDPEKRDLILMTRKSSGGYREIAEKLGCSISALKVRVHRAMKELRSTYRELEHEHV